MKFVIQRVTHASVEVEEQIVGKIGKGYLVLIGVGANDTKADADKLIRKMIGLRIFSDRERQDQPLIKGRGWIPAPCIPVHSLCELHQRKPSFLHRCRKSGARRGTV